MSVLRFLNIVVIKLHMNSWDCLQAFRLIYLSPSLECFLHFYLTQAMTPITWLSLVSKPGRCLLSAYF